MPTETNNNRTVTPTEPVWDNLPTLRRALYEIETEIEAQMAELAESDPEFARSVPDFKEASPRDLYLSLRRVIYEHDMRHLMEQRHARITMTLDGTTVAFPNGRTLLVRGESIDHYYDESDESDQPDYSDDAALIAAVDEDIIARVQRGEIRSASDLLVHLLLARV